VNLLVKSRSLRAGSSTGCVVAVRDSKFTEKVDTTLIVQQVLTAIYLVAVACLFFVRGGSALGRYMYDRLAVL
jgi:hypothetical protein